MRAQKRYPCGLVCGCEWGSKTCMQKRGYIWNYALNKWSRDSRGRIHRSAQRACDYAMAEQMTLLELR